MKGDFTRSTFKKENHYNSVRMQQGRVQLDADWNEQLDIQAHLRQTGALDVIGRTGVPKYGDGFAIGVSPIDPSTGKNDLTISSGRIYVDGILCELEEPGTTYFTQPDFPGAPAVGPDDYLVYLDVWQRNITALEDGNIREKALGGPDTATRAKTLWQVKLQSTEALECNQIDSNWQSDPGKEFGNLSARAKPGEVSEEPCILLPQGGYRRLENQLYRVEIHKNSTTGNATFKWSRDNGSIVARIETISGGEITVSHPVTGRVEEFAPGQWIELSDDIHELHGKPGILVKISSVKAEKLIIDLTTKIGTDNIELVDSSESGIDLTKFYKPHNAKVRRWDSAGVLEVNIPTDNDGFIPLEEGVEIKFETGKDYQTGDYWLIPARSATGSIEWPENVFKPPEGIKHHYCKLALVEIKDNKFVKFIQDCRLSFPPLNEIKMGESCCDVTVGDGKTSFGDVDSIQDAYKKVKPGGNICLLPGVHRANLRMIKGKNIAIKGCGKNTFVIPTPDNEEGDIFYIEDSVSITIENINFVTLAGTAIALRGTEWGKLKEINIRGCRIIAYKHAVQVERGTGINIMDNEIGMIDRDGGKAAIYMLAESSRIGQNDIRVIPAVTNIYTFPDGITDSYLQGQLEWQTIYNHVSFKDYVYWLWNIKLNQPVIHAFKGRGGIQIARGSVDIRINENRINGGLWNGITLGNLPYISENLNDGLNEYALAGSDLNEGEGELKLLKEAFNPYPHLENIKIEANEIINMGGNGIGVRCFFKVKEIPLIYIFREVAIYRNTINNCLRQIPPEKGRDTKAVMGYGGIALADCENLVIRENRVENNGNRILQPVAGIFILQGEDIDISDNRVFNNGPGPTEGNNNYMKGARGGIVIVFSFLRAVQVLFGDMQAFDKTNVSLTKIHDNIVKQPLGQALFIMAFGPVSIVGNHLMSQGVDIEACTLGRTAGAVLVLNFGISKDFLLVLLLTAIKNIGNSNPPGYMKTSRANTESGLEELWKKLERGFLYLPGGNILFSNNQITLKLHTRKFDQMVSSQFIFSLDDISYSANQSEIASIVDIVVANSIVYGITVRANDNRFQEGITGTLISLLSMGLMNSTTVNQGTNCIHVLGSQIHKVDAGNKTVYPGQFCGLILKILIWKYARAWLPEEPDEPAGEDSFIIVGIKRIDERGGYVFETRRITQCELIGWLNDSFDQVERLRSETLDQLHSIQKIKDTAIKIEYKRLSAELGQDHPRVKKLKARIDYNANMFKELDEMTMRTKIKRPEIDADTWVVHGMAIDKNRKGVKGLTVAFYSEKGELLEKVGYGSTDEKGYFSVRYSPKDGKSDYDKSMGVFVKVINKKREVLYQSSIPIFINMGTIETMEIDIPDEEEIITPPEGPGPTPDEDQWVVEGVVKDKENSPIQGVTVHLFDKRHVCDKYLGTKVTDENGKFKFTFKGENFQALIEANTEIFLKVVDKKGKTVYTSPGAVRCRAGGVDTFDIQVPYKPKKK